MHLKSFFTRLLVSIGFFALAAIGVILVTIIVGRFTMHRVAQDGDAPCACYVAGRTGGHLIPAMTLAQQHRARYPKAPIFVFTADTQLDIFVMKRYPWITHHEPLPLGNVPRGLTLSWFSYLGDLIRTTVKTFNLLRHQNPAFVTTTGGYIAVPVCLVARALGIPVYLYNLDLELGAAIKFLSRFATKITVCFDETKKFLPPSAHVELGSYPIRFGPQDLMDKTQARKTLARQTVAIDGLTESSSVLLVVGGSQGSRFINDLVPASVASFAHEKPIFVLHQTGGGEDEVQRVKNLYTEKKIPALVFPYRDDMPALYQAADLVITRAGAGSLFELIFFKKPAIIIPLETVTTAHQLANAAAAVRLHPELFTVQLQDKIGDDFGRLLEQRL